MYTAFQILGLKSMHMAELRFTPPGTHALWLEGLKAKYHDKGKKYGRVELDKLLGEYSVCCVHLLASLEYGTLLLIESSPWARQSPIYLALCLLKSYWRLIQMPKCSLQLEMRRLGYGRSAHSLTLCLAGRGTLSAHTIL